MKKPFIVDIIGNIPSEELNKLDNRLRPQLEKLELTPEYRIADENKDISTAYHETFNGHMLVVYGMPYHLPHFGSLSQELFGLREFDEPGKITKRKEYPKKIVIIPTNEREKLAWESYFRYLPAQFTWSGMQLELPEAQVILANIAIIPSVAEFTVPATTLIEKILIPREAQESLEYTLDEKFQARATKKYQSIWPETKLIFSDQYTDALRKLIDPASNHVIATVISCASDLKPVNEEHNRQMQEYSKILGQLGILYVYGGAWVGIMGLGAKAARDAGARISAVIGAPQTDRYTHHNPPFAELSFLENFIFTTSLQNRIPVLMKLPDVILMLPAGTGTFEELTYALAEWVQPTSKGIKKTIIIPRIGNHLDHVEKHLRELIDLEILAGPIYFINEPREMVAILEKLKAQKHQAKKEIQIGEWKKIIKQYDIMYRSTDSAAEINEVIIEKRYKLYTLVFSGKAVKLVYEAIKKNPDLSPYTTNHSDVPDIHFSENKLNVYIKSIHSRKSAAVKMILDGIYPLVETQNSAFSTLITELNKEFQSLEMLSVDPKKIEQKKTVNREQSASSAVTEKTIQIGEWKKTAKSRDVISYRCCTAGISEIILDKKYEMYSLVFSGDSVKSLYVTIQRHPLLSPYTTNSSVPDIDFCENKLTVYATNIHSQNPAAVKEVLNSIYRLIKIEALEFISLISELNKELAPLGMQNFEFKLKDHKTETSKPFGVVESLKKLSLITSLEAKIIDITDPNLEPLSKQGMCINSDYYVYFYYEKKIISLLLTESINNDQFKKLQELIQADFVTHIHPSHFFAKDIWSQVTSSTTYQTFTSCSTSIRQEISKKLSGNDSKYIYRTNHNADIRLSNREIGLLGYKIKEMLEDCQYGKGYFDAKDLFSIKEKNATNKQELLIPKYFGDRAYLEQEQDQPAGIYDTITYYPQYQACEQCEQDWDLLTRFILRMRFMTEIIHPDRIKQREDDLIKLSSYYSQKKSDHHFNG